MGKQELNVRRFSLSRGATVAGGDDLHLITVNDPKIRCSYRSRPHTAIQTVLRCTGGTVLRGEISTRADKDAALRMRRSCLILAPIPLSPPAC